MTSRRDRAVKRWIPRTAGAVALGFGLATTGCKGPQADMKLKKANEKIAEAEAVDAAKYAPEPLDAAKKAAGDAAAARQNKLNAEALDKAKAALASAEDAVLKAKQQYATEMGNKAKEARDVAVLNKGNLNDPKRFQLIQDTFKKIDEARSNNKWDDVITASKGVINEVELLLKPMKDAAEKRLIDAQNSIKSLTAEGAETYAPDKVIEVRDLVKQVEALIAEKQDFQTAKNQADLAIQKAEEGKEATRREKSKEQIAFLEGQIVVAIQEGAQLYAADSLKSVSALYDQLTADFQENRFDKVLLAADLLKPKVATLVITTKKAAAEARIQNIASKIGDLTEAGVKEYLPGRIDPMEAMLSKCRDLFKVDKEAEFDQIKAIAQDAAIEEGKIRSAFSELALDEIRKTRDQLDKAQAVFEKMQGVFIVQQRQGLSQVEQKFEDAKDALRNELGAGLQNARVNLEVARSRQEDGKFRGGIVLAKEVSTSVENILNEVYHVVGFNAVMELSEQISKYELDGAREYAGDELVRTKNLLDQTKQLIEGKSYRESVTKAAETRAQMELMVQAIAERASRQIEEARAAATKARSAETERYRAEELSLAVQLIDNAEKALAAKQLKSAVELAKQAAERAQRAATEAGKLAAEDSLENARSRIKRCVDAGANLYAGKEFEDAKRLLQSAESHFTAAEYRSAVEVSAQSSEKAERAFYRLIDSADAAISEAKSAGGWDRKRESLTQAIARNDEARRKIEAGQYAEAASLARSAESTAGSVAESSKLANYNAHVERIRTNLDAGRQQGITLFQVNETVAINQQLVDLEDRFDRSNLSNYEFTMDQLKTLEARLRTVLDNTEPRVKQVIADQNSELDQLVKDGAAEYAGPLLGRARENLKAAEIDFNRRLYKSAHASLSNAIAATREIKRRQGQETYVRDVRVLFDNMKEAQRKFMVLTQSPNTLKLTAQGERGRGRMVSLNSVFTPAQFREEVEKIYSSALAIKPPADQAKVHEDVIQSLNDARLGALAFEKLVILDQMTQKDAEALIDKAYSHVRSANNRIAILQNRFAQDEESYRESKADAGILAARK